MSVNLNSVVIIDTDESNMHRENTNFTMPTKIEYIEFDNAYPSVAVLLSNISQQIKLEGSIT